MSVVGHPNYHSRLTNHGHTSGQFCLKFRHIKSSGSELSNKIFGIFLEALKEPLINEQSQLLWDDIQNDGDIHGDIHDGDFDFETADFAN